MTGAMRLGAMVALLALMPAPCAAQLDSSGERTAGEGWRELLEPDRRDGLLHVRRGLRKLLEVESGAGLGFELQPWALLGNAIRHFEAARRARPDDPHVLYLLGHAHSRYQGPPQQGRRALHTDEAIEAWEALRALDPGFFPDRVGFELGYLYMRRRDYARSRAEYRYAAAHHLPELVQPDYRSRFGTPEMWLARIYLPISPALTYGNLAEASMLDGDLDAAVRHYRRSIDEGDGDPRTYSLGHWGLALALDRQGHGQAAAQAAWTAIQSNPYDPQHPLSRRHGPMSVLHAPGVSFDPESERHAYQALGHEALAAHEDGQRRRAALAAALDEWRLFVQLGGTNASFLERGEAHVERLEAELSGPRRRRPRP